MALLLLAIAFATLWKSTEAVEAKNCDNGCLTCTPNDICLLCDSSNFYVRSGYTCVKRYIENCEATIDGQTCQRCKNPYYVNTTINTCVQAALNITGCLYYNSSTSCLKCQSDSYVDAKGSCSKIEKEIPRCVEYNTNGKCKTCLKSTLNADGTACDVFTTIDNCAFYTSGISCTTCVTGVYYNQNKYLMDMKEDPAFLKDFFNETVYAKEYSNYLLRNKTNVCVKPNRNCAVYKDYNICTECLEGYFLLNGTCMTNPKEAINNCVEYSGPSVCTVCAEGYYNETNQKCTLQPEIKNCNKYSKTALGVCRECADQFYFNETAKACVQRSIVIKNCAKFVWNAEKCEVCKDSYLVSPDNNQCFAKISKCQTHLFIDQSGGVYNLICNTCLSGFYIKTKIENNFINTSCVLPTVLIEGCDEYQTNTICNTCLNNYFLANFKCIRHDQTVTKKISCKNYSTKTQNTCSECNNLEFLYQIYNYCEIVDSPVVNCRTYGTDQSCIKCIDTHYLSQDNLNKTICAESKEKSCLKVNTANDTCLLCDTNLGYAPNNADVGNKCLKMPAYINSNCEDMSVNVLPKYSLYCKGCTAPNYPKNYTDNYYQFCVTKNELTDFRSKLTDADISSLVNCNSFDFDKKECLICDQKSDKPYVASDSKKCNTTCNFEDEVILTFDFKDNSPHAYFTCRGISTIHMSGENTENCRRVDYDVSVNKTTSTNEKDMIQLCAECKPGFISLVTAYLTFTSATNTYNYTHYDYLPLSHLTNSLATKSYFSNKIKRPLIFSCVPWVANTMFAKSITFTDAVFKKSDSTTVELYKPSSNYFVQNWAKFENCRVLINFKTQATEAYGCGACKFGYTGIVINATDHDVNNPKHFVHSCSKMTECDTNIYYSGIGSHSPQAFMDYFVSCHACQDTSKIVTVVDRRPWTYVNSTSSTLTNYLQTNGYYPYNTCYIPGLIQELTTQFPKDCKIQQIIPNKKLQFYTPDFVTPPNPACVACAPGFYPKLSDTNLQDQPYPYIKSCEKITNCKSSAAFNQCEQCEDGFVLEYSKTERGFTSGFRCVANSIEGCIVGEENGKCYRCSSGYILNMSGVCDDGKLEKCTTKGVLTPMYSAFDYLTTDPFGKGCLKCAEESYSVRFDFLPIVCVLNKANETFTVGKDHYVANCQQYGYDLKTGLKCNICNSGFYMTDDGKFCIKERTANCLIYNINSLTQATICVKCKNGYYLKEGSCFEGQIKGCLEYTNKENCKTCMESHMATRINLNQYTICMNITSSVSNCGEFDPDNGFAGILNCFTCKNSTYPKPFDIPVKTCAKFYPTANCLEYALSDSFTSSSFFCLRCSEPYYVIPGQFPPECRHRTYYPINNCLIYSKISDICEKCITNFFLSADRLSCNPNPAGIQGCRNYTSFKTCSECKPHYYPYNGACVPVSPEKIVTNCYNYTADISCNRCDKGYQFKNNACATADIQNCQVPDFDGKCQTCITDYHKINEKCEKASLQFCDTYSSTTACQKCQQGYYLVSGRCFDPLSSIDRCVEYESKTVCSLCQDGYLIESNKGKCIKLEGAISEYINPSCKIFERKTSCLACDEGYYFEKGSCVQCGTPRGTCRYCNPQDNAKCLMCTSGYHMTPDMVCVNDTQIATNKTLDKDADPFYDFLIKKLDASLLRAISLWLLIGLLIIK